MFGLLKRYISSFTILDMIPNKVTYYLTMVFGYGGIYDNDDYMDTST